MNTKEKIKAIENSIAMSLHSQTITAAEGLVIVRGVTEALHRHIAYCTKPEPLAAPTSP